jgi:hypothetical protein
MNKQKSFFFFFFSVFFLKKRTLKSSVLCTRVEPIATVEMLFEMYVFLQTMFDFEIQDPPDPILHFESGSIPELRKSQGYLNLNFFWHSVYEIKRKLYLFKLRTTKIMILSCNCSIFYTNIKS